VPSLDMRMPAPLRQEQINCQGSDCIETSPEMEVTDFPVISSDPNCPIIGFKVMHDDGNGIPTHEVDRNMLRIEVNGAKMTITQDNAAIK
jgi:hypothetical protein